MKDNHVIEDLGEGTLDQAYAAGLIATVNHVVSDAGKEIFQQPGIQSFFAQLHTKPGLDIGSPFDQRHLADGTSVLIGPKGAIAVTGLKDQTDGGFTRVNTLRQGEGIGYHDFQLTWDQTRWLILDLTKCQTLEDMKRIISEYQSSQP